MKRFYLLLGLFLTQCTYPIETALYKQNPAVYSYVVGDAKTGIIKAQHLSEIYATPASYQKIITALLAYKELGEDFCFETKLYKLGKNDVLIQFSGDPTLTIDDIKELLLKYPCKGTIYLDINLFKTPAFSKNLMLDDLGLKYCSPIFAGTIDESLFQITVDEKGHTTTSMPYPIKTSVIKGDKTSISLRWEGPQLFVYGTVKEGITFSCAPIDAADHLIRKIKTLTSRPIIITYSQHPSKVLVTTHLSKPLKDTLPPAFKLSNNLFFDTLYIILLHKYETHFEDWDAGSDVMKKLLKQHFDIDAGNSRMVDGSGLSRYNRLQPKMLFEALCKGRALIENAMPYPGHSCSSLAHRTYLPSTIYAKSGTISGVNNLAGYHGDKAFVLFISNYSQLPKEQETLFFAKITP